MKKILMIGDSVYPDTMGGSHRHIYDVCKRLSEKDYEVSVYSPKNCLNAQSSEFIDGFNIYRYKRSANPIVGLLDFFLGPLKIFLKQKKSGCLPDVIHGHWPLTCFFVWLYVKIKKMPIKLVYTFHGPVVEEYAYELKYPKPIRWLFLKMVRFVESTVLKKSDVITTASHYMKNKEIALYGNENKVVVNYLAIDEHKFDIVAKDDYPEGFDKNCFKYVFTLRRLKKRMGIQLLLNAFALVVKEKGESFKLLIGGKGDYRSELERLAKDLKIEKNVVFLGFLADDDLKRFYSASDVCVVPSLDLEGFGLTTAEAMACGTPVVATNVCANTEILNAITPDLLVPQDAKQMATAIIAAAEKNMDSTFLRNYVLKTFDWNKTIAGYLNLYT